MRRLIIAAALLAASTACVLAQGTSGTAPTIPTSPVSPTETGENSASNAQILSIARLKLGYCTGTTVVPEATQTVTCNGAMGILTTGMNITVVSNGKDLITVTNNKVLATDACIAMIDDTGAAAASVPEVTGCRVPAAGGQLILVVSNASATSPAAALKVYFMVLTAGNPH